MNAPICTERLQAAQAELASIISQSSSSRVWTFTHPETGVDCRAEFADGILTVEAVLSDEPGPEEWWDEGDEDVAATEHALAKSGVLCTHVGTAAAAERELRLITDAITEVV